MKSKPKAKRRKLAPKPRAKAKPRLLSGGNPQIAKGEGDAPVRAYIAATSISTRASSTRRS